MRSNAFIRSVVKTCEAYEFNKFVLLAGATALTLAAFGAMVGSL